MKIICWNINSINTRLQHVLDLLEKHQPDFLLLQELKCEDHKFPYDAFSDTAYNIYLKGEKSYNGVAILSKYRVENVEYDFPNNKLPNESRFIKIDCVTSLGFTSIICLYAPNGGEYGSIKFINKMNFFQAFYEYLSSISSSDSNIIVGGDFNIAPFNIDFHSIYGVDNSTCSSLTERIILRQIFNLGYFDTYRLDNIDTNQFSWWDYRKGSFAKNQGMRIDLILCNARLCDKLHNTQMLVDYRSLDKPSDHAPIMSQFLGS